MRTFPVVIVISTLAACANAPQPPARQAVTTPPLDPKVSRVLITAGMRDRGNAQSVTLTSVRQVGPVYFDGKWVGDIAQNEYIVVDVEPGTHDVACSPMEPMRNYAEPRKVSFEAGETKSLVCEMATASSDVGENYKSKTYLEPREINSAAAPVAYKKIP